MSDCQLHEDDGIMELELNRPEAMNALSQSFLDEIITALEQVQADPNARVLIIKSASHKAFCAGADLKERRQMNEDQVRAAVGKIRRTMNLVNGLKIPTIAAIRGVALGGGFELALACDLRVVSETATIGLTETRLAIIPGAGGTQRLSRLIGVARAKDLIFTGRKLTGVEAYQMGIAEYLVTDVEVHQRAKELAKDIAQAGPIAIRQAKWAIDEGYAKPLVDGLAVEETAYEQVINTEDRQEGLKAFAEKRKPKYLGR